MALEKWRGPDVLWRERPDERWWLIIHLGELARGAEQFYILWDQGAAKAEGGQVKSYELPDGVEIGELRGLLEEVKSRRRELTSGYRVKAVGGEAGAVWEESVKGATTAREFWDRDVVERLEALGRKTESGE